MLSSAEIEFIKANEGADTRKLLLSNSKRGDINLPLCVKCIEARRKMKIKAPLWYGNTALSYPFSVSVEQGSSQTTAEFKRDLIEEIIGEGGTTADLTGGMGIDSYFISTIEGATHYYFERNSELCSATEYNFGQLGAENIICSNIDITENSCEAMKELEGKNISLLYIDPARRDKSGGKTILLQDYEPNILEILPQMFAVAPWVLVKISPMADIKLNLKFLPQTSRIYVVAVDNECKELLFLLDKNCSIPEPKIICKNLSTKALPDKSFTFTLSAEESAAVKYTSEIGEFLYEPGKDILKAGAYKIISTEFNCGKLAPSTHLYTSNEEILDFPGKKFTVQEVIPFNKKALKEVAKRYPAADITARNFPMDTNALKKLGGIKDGGNHHIFAVTLTNSSKVIIVCGK